MLVVHVAGSVCGLCGFWKLDNSSGQAYGEVIVFFFHRAARFLLFGFPQLSMEQIFGWLLAPVAWLLGVPWADADTVGSLMGVKIVLNEFIAYLQLSDLLSAGDALSPRASIISAYALLGFANFSTIAIQIGGIGGMAPERRGDLARLGVRAMIGGNLAAFMSAAIAGMLI